MAVLDAALRSVKDEGAALIGAILLALTVSSAWGQNGFGPDEPIAYIGHGSMFGRDGTPIEPTLDFLQDAQDYYLRELTERASPAAREEAEALAADLEARMEGVGGGGEMDRPLGMLMQMARIGPLAADVDPPGEVMGKLSLIQGELMRRVEAVDPVSEAMAELEAFLEGRATPSGGAVLLSTFSEGAAYAAECTANGVPIPPGWNEPGWRATGVLTDKQEFISKRREARPYVHTSTSPPGTCIALPRFADNGSGTGDGTGTGEIGLLGIICLGTQTSKACFWDNSTLVPNAAGLKPSFTIDSAAVVALSEFNAGAGLKDAGGGVCTECHAGENPFVIHPDTPLGLPALGAELFGEDWHDPLVHPDWPQNAGPTNILASIPSPGSCVACHSRASEDESFFGGRFPLISSTIGTAAETSAYCGILRDAIARTMPPEASSYPDPNYAAHSSALQAMCADPASPVMRVEDAVIDYDEVELGFSFAKAIVLHNDGDADLGVSVELTTPASDPNLAHWNEIGEVADFVIAPGDAPLVLRQIYQPQGLGDHAITMRVTSSDPSAPTVDVSLVGEGVAPRPIDTALVLDRSGSMNDLAGDRRKIEALRDAAMLYTDLLREDLGGSGTGDGLALVKYNEASGVHLPLTTIMAGSGDTIAGGPLSIGAIGDLARLAPEGNTGIGGAMQTAADVLGAPAPDRSQVMVVLTDGKENRPPFIEAALADLAADHPQVATYAVGLGFDVEPIKLQALSNAGAEGYHQVTSTLSEQTLFDLETFYFKIFSDAAGMDLVTDPTHVVDLRSTAPVLIDRATVISSDRSATFLVMEDPVMRSAYELELVSPRGEVVRAGALSGGAVVQERTRATYRIVRVVFPDAAQAPEYIGDWLLRVAPREGWSPRWGEGMEAESRFGYGGRAIRPSRGTVPIGFAGAVASDYRMQVGVAASSDRPGAVLRLSAELTDRGWPAANGTVEVEVTRPSGAREVVTLHDDGAHGDGAAGDAAWAATFERTAAPGTYGLLFRAAGTNERGELAPRLAQRYVTLAQAGGPIDGGSGDGASGGAVASYLIGSYDLRFDNRALVDVMNPTGRDLVIALALFDRGGEPIECVREELAPNGLAEFDIAEFGPDEPLGVVKVVALDPERSEPVVGIVGNQVWFSEQDRSEAPLHPVSQRILEGDLERIRDACGF